MTYLNPNKIIFTDTGSDNTPEGAMIRSGGKHSTKTITLSANNTSASVNVFQLTGVVKINLLHGEVVDATTFSNCTSVYFDLWDGTTSVPITKTTGASMSGYNVGAFFIKDSDVSSALSTLNNASTGFKEPATGQRVNTEFLAIQKTATNTYIRFNYTTTSAPINAQIKVDVAWADIDSGTLTAV
jgi:hypothetical protein